MKDINTMKATVLTAALPYIQKYYGKTVVIKYGGNAMTNETLKQAVMQDIVLLSLVGIKVVLVHGGGPEINAMLKKINKQSEFVNGLRYTDEETIDIVQMVLAGKVNKDLVQLLQRAGGKAMGLCGLDGDLIKAKQLNPDLGFVGDITEIDPDPINTALNNGYIPVVSTVASGKNGEVFNINADTAASKLAVSEHISVRSETKTLEKLSSDADAMSDAIDTLQDAVNAAKALPTESEKAVAFHDNVLPVMDALRAAADDAETICGEDYWPLPSYSKMLYYV